MTENVSLVWPPKKRNGCWNSSTKVHPTTSIAIKNNLTSSGFFNVAFTSFGDRRRFHVLTPGWIKSFRVLLGWSFRQSHNTHRYTVLKFPTQYRTRTRSASRRVSCITLLFKISALLNIELINNLYFSLIYRVKNYYLARQQTDVFAATTDSIR